MIKKEFIDQIEAYPDNAEIRIFDGEYWDDFILDTIEWDPHTNQIFLNDRR